MPRPFSKATAPLLTPTDPQSDHLDQAATTVYTQAFTALQTVDPNDPATKKTLKTFLAKLRAGECSQFPLAPPFSIQDTDGRGRLFPPLSPATDPLPSHALSGANLGDVLRRALGAPRLALVPGKYRRAELFGFRAIDPELGPVLILAVTEKGDRGSGWAVTADPLAPGPWPAWANQSPWMPPAPLAGGYGAPNFQAWQVLSMQVMAVIGQPTDPRRWFPPSSPAVQAWWAARDRLQLEAHAASDASTTAPAPRRPGRSL